MPLILPINIESRKTYDILQPLKEKGRVFFLKEPHLIFPWVARPPQIIFVSHLWARLLIDVMVIECLYLRHKSPTTTTELLPTMTQTRDGKLTPTAHHLVVAAQNTLLRILKLGRNSGLNYSYRIARYQSIRVKKKKSLEDFKTPNLMKWRKLYFQDPFRSILYVYIWNWKEYFLRSLEGGGSLGVSAV